MLKNYLDKKINITRQKYLGTYKDTKKKTNKVNAGTLLGSGSEWQKNRHNF